MIATAATLQMPIAAAFEPLLYPARYKGAYGGRGSAKSHTFAGMAIEDCLRFPGMRFLCVREYQRSLNESVKLLLEDKIRSLGLSRYFRVLNTHIETPGNGIIAFVGMANHTAESIKSLEGFRRVWVEEAQSLSQRSLDLLRPTIRMEDSELWFSWNPRRPSDPVDDFFRGNATRTPEDKARWTPPPDCILVRANYTDNPWLNETLAHEAAADKRRDPDKYAHVWLGEYERNSEARVFRNWRVEAFETPADASFLFGGDFGFAEDPTVLVRSYVKGRTLYVDREAYQVRCEIDHTPALFDLIDPSKPRMAREWRIIADSARPETISYLRRHGYPRIRPARKGPGSVEEGIEFLKSYDIVVHPRCTHTIDELTLYSFKTDPLTGLIIPVLEDKKNHVIDALRYGCEAIRFRQGGGAGALTIDGL